VSEALRELGQGLWARAAALRFAGLAATMGVAAVLAPSAAAQGVDTTCTLPLTKVDAATVNVAYPDEAALYYAGVYQAAPGTRIRISGRYPHARYMSFNVYDNLQRPLDALADVEIAPEAGSSNPFAAGADRNAGPRDYTAFVDFGPLPQQRAPNTLYTGTGQGGTPNFQGSFIYRIYVPDRERDERGGVGLPTVTLEATASGGRPPDSVCAEFAKPAASGVNEQVAATNGLPVSGSAEAPGRNPPTWRKFVNLPRSLADNALDNVYTDPARQAFNQTNVTSLGGSGGYLSNIHNAYLTATINRNFGRVLVTRLRTPSFPDTRPAPARMPGGQLRYFSMCQNETISQRFIACRTDDQTTVRSGFASYVISTPEQRPANARPECGVTWLPWGPQPGGVLIYRHMLPDPGFAQAIQRVPEQGKEAETMGDFFPVSKYYADPAAFEALGCAELRGSNPVAAAACRDTLAPRSSVSHRRLRATRAELRLSGRAIDPGCRGGASARSRAGRVASVSAWVARRVGSRCRFVGSGGRLGAPRSCSRPVLLPARLSLRAGRRKADWALKRGISLPPGSYEVASRARDTAGNKESRVRGYNHTAFAVR
jgi:hypothetical protein